MCPATFNLVCGTDNNEYDNACKAKCADVNVKNEGPCKITPTTTPKADVVKRVDWKVGMSDVDQKVVMDLEGKNSVSLHFKWSGYHNVYMFPDKASFDDCDFTMATEMASKSPYTFSASKAGNYYFGCEVYVHCDNDQKLMLQVTGACSCLPLRISCLIYNVILG